ncbi:TolC family protein [Sphingomonas sp. BIUV-7]|uniref:TolC family protein n=1 Tax=Sphingomonas natans TaxID=3063330 RepID=A0ABT8Y8E8_9SPHN|nr:TolC family protein [Sphingomonas sp. BIUV-7]MDO6414602.1 TolC family protein [Sphingomonas sp. BIUV-7]
MHRILAAVLAASACASALQAQTIPLSKADPVLTLDGALMAAGAASPAIAAARSGVKAAQAQRSVAGVRPNPSLDMMAENVAGTGIYNGLRSTETTLGLSIPLELGNKRGARVAVANAQLDRATLNAAMMQADLRLRVTQAYNDAAAAERRLTNAREQVGIANAVLRGAKVRVSAGRASPLEAQRADVARLNAQGAAERAERSASVAMGNLVRLIDRDAPTLDVAWFNRIEMTGPSLPVSGQDTLAGVAAQADLTTATAQVRLARSQRVPTVTLGAAARRLEASNDTTAVFSLSVPLPLFNNGRASLDLASAQRQQADAQRRMALLDVEQAMASANAEAENAATTARNAAGPTLAVAQEAARIARIGYREGKFGQLDLLEAERTLADTRAAAIDALAAYHDAKARLERLTAPVPTDAKDAR